MAIMVIALTTGSNKKSTLTWRGRL